MTTRNRLEFTANQERAPTREERRDFLRLSGSVLALAAAGCTRAPRGKIVPYASQPPEVTPGVASHYATTLLRDGYGVGVVVESHEGRPTKIEGNPGHPASLGGTGVFEQATVLGVYDRDRGMHVTRRGSISSFDEVAGAAKVALGKSEGSGARFLLEPTSSDLTVDLVRRVREKYPGASFHFHSALSLRRAWEGARLAFGEVVEPIVDFRKVEVVVALDADFLTTGPAALRYARHFANGRRVADAASAMNRLYVVEPAPTVTGSTADHRFRMRRSAIPAFARVLFAELAVTGSAPKDLFSGLISHRDDLATKIAQDLAAHRGRAVVVVGEAQPPAVHALGHAMNELLGAFDGAVSLAASPIFEAGQPSHSPSELASALDASDSGAIFVLGGNPVYASPRDLDLANRIRRAAFSVHLGAYENETSQACGFYVPQSHTLESWGAARAFDGTLSWIQPLLGADPACRTVDEILAAIAGGFSANAHGFDLVSSRVTRETLRAGVVEGSAFAPKSLSVDWHALTAAFAHDEPDVSNALELVLHEDARVRDGADTNNPWLLELPDPTTKLTWENAALVSKATAARLGIETGDVVTLDFAGGHVDAPVLVGQGHADDSVSLAFGYGRTGSETIADGVGANAFALRALAQPWGGTGLVVRKTGRVASLALAQSHFSIEGRDDDIFLRATLAEFRASPNFAKSQNAEKRSLYVFPNASGRQWGMVVDLSACTGCSACVVACQAENNIAVVGKAGVTKGREMHWIRIDRYFDDESDDARAMHEPMLCQHCERAPCEYVCPVNATTHSADGLNQMVYNRCVGTRFCSNNCPWKVRRFNWFDYDRDPDAADPRVHNPDVTVRSRGVMEKCTYCVQRIREAEIHAKVEGRALADHDVKTACEQACPSAAIVFGDIADPKSSVSAARANPRLFGVLNDLGTRAHTRYLAKIENRNEKIE